MFIVVCYDIPDDKRRTRLSNSLEGFGYRVQRSVFECELSQQHFERMTARIREIIKPDEDSVRCYSLCQSCLPKITIDGLGEVQRDKPYFIA